MKFPHNFNEIVFPSGVLAYKYAPGTSNVDTSISSYVSIINVVNSASSNIVGDEIIYPSLKYRLWLIPFANALSFMVLYILFFIIFTSSIAFYFSELNSTSGMISAMNFFPGMMP